jgi:hypothetical protein
MAENGIDDSKLIFIGGSPRSGTTLVQNMLDSHPLVLGGPEFLHLPDIINLRRKLHSSITREWIDIFCSKEDVDNQLSSWIKKLFLSLAEKHRCGFYSEKTPENILVFSELMEMFPRAHFIQVIRDPRAILSSMRQVRKRAIEKGIKPPSFTANTSTSIAYIKGCFESGVKISKREGQKILTVIYEKLISDPVGETKKICEHVGIEWNDRMLCPGEKEHLGDRAITLKSNEIWYDSKSYNRNIAPQNSEKWRRELSLYQQLAATMAFANNEELIAYGYDFSIVGVANGKSGFSQAFVYSLSIGMFICRMIKVIMRKIPGYFLLRNGLRNIVRLIKMKA